MNDRPSPWRVVWLAMRTRRTAAVSLLSFSSGLPLGLVWIAIPTWMARIGVDIKIIGLFTLAADLFGMLDIGYGWMILGAILIISGIQCCLFAMWFDMDYNKDLKG